MKIIPATEIVVVVPVDISEISRSQSGIIAVQKEQPEVGKVVVVGGRRRKNREFIEIKKGDIVVYRKYGESKFIIEGEEYSFVDVQDVLGIIRK